MANPEHLAIVKQGVEAWNEWRRQNPDVSPDFTGADLSDVNLIGVDLKEADLYRAHLTDADLSAADLRGAYLIAATLMGANLYKADLTGADLKEANLYKADLIGADLIGADLFKADLSAADFVGADLSRADLRHARARFSQLCRCNLTGAKLTGANLYATAREDWTINGVECEYILLDIHGQVRIPRDRDFAPGEFEQIYKTLPTIEYVFQNGMTPMDPLIMARVVQAIREQNPEFDIKVDSISARGLAPSIKFTVQQEEHKEPALAEVSRMYEAKVCELTGRLDEVRTFIQLLIDRPGSINIVNATGQYLAIGGSTINIDQHVEYITNLRDAVAALPENSPTFAKVAKKTALDIIGSALKDVAKGQVKETAKQIYELGKNLGPVVLDTAAYAFFRSQLG